ncbi:MAG: peptide chain release factor 1 [Planctomycetota bacterium]
MTSLHPTLVQKLRERAQRHAELTEQLADPELASDVRRFPALLRERGSLEISKDLYDRVCALTRREQEARELLESGDADMADLASEDLAEVEREEHELDEEIKLALIKNAEDDRTKVIFEIRAGTGGDEATLFAGDLFRMYQRWFETRRYKIEMLSESESEVGGYKELSFAVEGEGAWRALQFESGVHRVQRVPATETKGRVHTSAATVAVLPEAEEAEVDIHENDLRIDTMRSSGPGGQSVNKTSSAVRITHLPTDTVVICQDEKSQHKNKAKAMRILRARLFEAEQARIHAERSAARKSQVGTGDRSAKVRTYNWPQNRVTDHRLEGSEHKNFNLEQIVAGRLDPLLSELEALDRERRLQEL